MECDDQLGDNANATKIDNLRKFNFEFAVDQKGFSRSVSVIYWGYSIYAAVLVVANPVFLG